MPTRAQSSCFICTYRALGPSSPTRMVPRPGVIPRAVRSATRAVRSSRMRAATDSPSRICALTRPVSRAGEGGGSGPDRGRPRDHGAGDVVVDRLALRIGEALHRADDEEDDADDRDDVDHLGDVPDGGDAEVDR